MDALPSAVLLGLKKPLQQFAIGMGLFWLSPATFLLALTSIGLFAAMAPFLAGAVLVVMSWFQITRLDVDPFFRRRMLLASAMLYLALSALGLSLLLPAMSSALVEPDLRWLSASYWATLAAGGLFGSAMLHLSRRMERPALMRAWRGCLWLLPVVVVLMACSMAFGMAGLGRVLLFLVFPVAFYFAVRSTTDALQSVADRLRRGPAGLQELAR